jgi:hypothetical protein
MVAKSIETRVYGTSSASIYMGETGLELSLRSSESTGSFWWNQNPKWNMSRGVMEFSMESYTPFSNSQYRLDLKDVGGVGSDDPVDNRHNVSWYEGDGISAISDWSQPANLFSTVTAPKGQTNQTIPLDVTLAIQGHQSHGVPTSHVGFRFEPASPTAFESFGRTSSFNPDIVFSLVAIDDVMSILKNPNALKPVLDPKNPAFIQVFFEPKSSLGTPIELKELATALGVSEFNWLSQVIDTPKSWLRKEIWLDVETTKDGQFLAEYVDPPLDGKPGYFVHTRDRSPVKAYEIKTPFADLPPRQPSGSKSNFFYLRKDGNWNYWVTVIDDPEIGLDHDKSDLYYGFGQTPELLYSVGWSDRPLQPVGAFEAGESIKFETKLVGISDNGSVLDTGVSFKWGSNAEGDIGKASFGGTAGGPGSGAYLRGGAFLVGEGLPDPSPPLVERPSITLSLANASVKEDGPTNLVYTFTRSGSTSSPLTVNYSVGGSASRGIDYTGIPALPATKSITFAAGSATASLRVDPTGDRTQEANETVALRLLASSGYSLGTASAVTGTILNDDRIGTSAKNTIVGTAMAEFIDGLQANDTLTGGVGPDVFGFRYSHSTLTTPDRITDFRFASDKIDLFTASGGNLPAPAGFTRASNNSTARTLSDLAAAVFRDANGTLAGNQALGANRAALVVATRAPIAGTYLFINDGNATRNNSNDLLINLTGFSGALPGLGVNPVDSVFT